MIESSADWDVFMDADVFAAPVTYVGDGQPPTQIYGILTAAHVEVGSGLGGVSTVTPVLAISAQTLPFTPAADDQVTLDQAAESYAAGTTFRVADTQPDGSGMIRLILERN